MAKLTLQVIQVPMFVDEPEDVERLALDFVVEEVRERTAAAARESVRANMVASLPTSDRADAVLTRASKSAPNRGLTAVY